MVWTYSEEGQWTYWTKDFEDETGAGEKRKTTEEVHGCSEVGDAVGWFGGCQVRWRKAICCGDPLRERRKDCCDSLTEEKLRGQN